MQGLVKRGLVKRGPIWEQGRSASSLDPVLQKSKILLKARMPGPNGEIDSSKVFVISFFPQTPGSSVERFDEERMGQNGLCVLQRHKPILEVRPVNT